MLTLTALIRVSIVSVRSCSFVISLSHWNASNSLLLFLCATRKGSSFQSIPCERHRIRTSLTINWGIWGASLQHYRRPGILYHCSIIYLQGCGHWFVITNLYLHAETSIVTCCSESQFTTLFLMDRIKNSTHHEVAIKYAFSGVEHNKGHWKWSRGLVLFPGSMGPGNKATWGYHFTWKGC